MSKTKVQLSWRQHQTLKFLVDKELIDCVKQKCMYEIKVVMNYPFYLDLGKKYLNLLVLNWHTNY